MIKGIDGKLKPFLSKVILNDPKVVDLNKKDQFDYYYSRSETGNEEMLATMHFSIKSTFKKGVNPKTLNAISNGLDSATLNLIVIDDKEEFFAFSTFQKQQKTDFIRSNSNRLLRKKLAFSRSNINKYIYRSSDIKTLNVPLEITTKIDFLKNTEIESNKNPNFLGCVYFLSMGNSVLEDTINMEVMFNAGLIYNKTGYFVIGDSYGYNKQEFSLTKAGRMSSEESKLLSVIPGLSGIISDESEENINQKANEIFGSPGDVWAGPVHFHKVNDPANPNFGKSRAMAGAAHNDKVPHPYLFYVTKPNTKVVDFRSLDIFEDLLSYKSVDYSRVLASSEDVTYTGQKNNIPIDNLIKNKSILSEGKFSIRPVTKTASGGAEKTKDNLSFFFAIDKKSLLVNTTKLSNLLQKLTVVDQNLFYKLTENLSITHFEIIRINKKTGESKSLLVGDNDTFFDDSKTLNRLGNNISKGFSLTNKTNELFIENSGVNDYINFYEFVDGELDAKKDNGRYSYEVKLKFRDPMIEYLTDRLRQITTIVRNLDELAQKASFMMRDPATGRMVKVFDEFQGILNQTFVAEAINPTNNPVLPVSFRFNTEQQIPVSVANSFTNVSNLSNLNLFFIALDSLFCESFNVSSSQATALSLNSKNYFTSAIKSALRLSTTTPLLLEKICSFMKNAEAKTRKLVNIYSAIDITKKSRGFTSTDFLKSTTVDSRDVYLVEFDYKFDNVIDLEKSKNNFNWIEEARNYGNNGGIKEISAQDYKSIVQNPNLVDFLTDAGRAQFAQESDFDYSFLPYSSPASLSLQKASEADVYLNYLQTVRNKVLGDMKDAGDSVLIPEVLSNFGVRIIPSKLNQESYLTSTTTYNNKRIPVNNSTEDNFGTSFTTKTNTRQEQIAGCDIDTISNENDTSFGATTHKSFAWQGGSYKDYPINFSLAFMNLLLTNSFRRRNINFLNKEKEGVSEDTRFPFSVNFFSSDEMSDLNSAKTFITDVIENLYDANGKLKFDNYHYHSYLLGIFSRVYYLKGFELKTDNSYNYGDLSTNSKILPTTSANGKFIKKMNWAPLSLEVLENIPQDKKLLCKVMFFEDDTETCLIDKKIIDMYKDYSNYNQLFYVNRNNQTPVVDQVTSFNTNRRLPGKEVQTESHGAKTREQLNREVKSLNTLIQDEKRETSNENTKDEDVAFKKNLTKQRNTVKVIQKRE